MEQTVFKILVLEDDPDLREMLEDVLQEQGYEVHAVASGEQAVGLANAEAFDLFIADIRMEGMGGLKAIEQAQDQQSDLGSLVISGWASEEETLEAVRLQVGGYLKKPFSMADLIERVKKLLSQRAEQIRREQEKRVLQSTALWSLQTLARVSDQAALLAPRGALSRVELVAGELAKANQLDAPTTRQIQVAAAVAALVELGNIKPPEIVERSSALGPLFEVLRDFRASVTHKPELSLIPQIGGLALAAALRGPEEALPRVEAIMEEHPGRFSEGLLRQYGALDSELQCHDDGASPEILLGLRDPHRLQRSLLSVAKTMEACGELGSSAEAYRKLLEHSVNSTEATAACLGLARLALREGASDQAAGWALEAPRRAKSSGPSAFGQAALGCGLMLLDLGHEQAEASLKAAQRVLQRVGLDGSAAIAKVALGDFEHLEQTLQVLADPTQWNQISKLAAHILPKLLEKWEDAPPWPLVERLVLAFADSLKELESTLSTTSKMNLITILGKNEQQASAPLLESLANSHEAKIRAGASTLLRRKQGKSSNPFLRIQSLGFFELFLGESKLDDQLWRTQKTKYLVGYLLSRIGKAVLAEELVEVFWPETRAKAEQNLWAATSAARRVLKPGEYILREGETLKFDWDTPYWHDYEELSKSLDALGKISFESDSEGYGRLSQQVAQLYTGPYLDGCYMEWAVRIRGQLEFQVSETLVKGAHSFLRRRLYPESLEMADRALEVDSLRSEAYLMKMRAHLGLGQPEKTISSYEAGVSMLKREFDMEPPTTMLEILMRAKNGLPDPGN
jgi:two-component SAPR family response regulator